MAVRPGGPLKGDGVSRIGVYRQFSRSSADVAGDVGRAKCARGDETQVLVQSIPASSFWAGIIRIVEPPRIRSICDLALDGDATNITMGGGK